MTLQKRTYDSIWYVAAAISVWAVFVVDGGYAWPRWLLPILLGSAISISAYLSLFVRRSTTERTRNISDNLVEPVCDQEKIGLQQWEEAILVAEENDKILDIRDIFEEVVEMRSDELRIHMRAEISDYLRHSEHLSVINYTRSLLKQAANEQQVARRRNITLEACKIARTLHGTGAEVLISPNDCILIREGRQDTEMFAPIASSGTLESELPN